jgi:hypothetical protein
VYRDFVSHLQRLLAPALAIKIVVLCPREVRIVYVVRAQKDIYAAQTIFLLIIQP